MERLAQTEGLTDIQQDILATAEVQKMIIGRRLLEEYRLPGS